MRSHDAAAQRGHFGAHATVGMQFETYRVHLLLSSQDMLYTVPSIPARIIDASDAGNVGDARYIAHRNRDRDSTRPGWLCNQQWISNRPSAGNDSNSPQVALGGFPSPLPGDTDAPSSLLDLPDQKKKKKERKK